MYTTGFCSFWDIWDEKNGNLESDEKYWLSRLFLGGNNIL